MAKIDLMDVIEKSLEGKHTRVRRTGKLTWDETAASDRATKILAAAVKEQIKDNLKQGKASDGSQLPPIKSSTRERRADWVNQARRGGEAHPRYKNAEVRSEARRNFKKQFPKAWPLNINSPRGNFTGTLIQSFEAVPAKVRGVVGAKVRPSGKRRSQGAWGGALGNPDRAWDAKAEVTPAMKRAFEEAEKQIITDE